MLKALRFMGGGGGGFGFVERDGGGGGGGFFAVDPFWPCIDQLVVLDKAEPFGPSDSSLCSSEKTPPLSFSRFVTRSPFLALWIVAGSVGALAMRGMNGGE